MKVDIDLEKMKVELSFQESDFYSLDTVMAIIIHASMVKYKEVAIELGHPGVLSSTKEWENILDTIIGSFSIIVEDCDWQLDKKKEYQVKQGLKLFAEWYGWFWS